MSDSVSDSPHGPTTKFSNFISGPRRISANESKAQTRNRYEMTRLSIRIKQIDKEIETTEHLHKKEMRQLRASMRSVRETTGKTEPPEQLKSAKDEISEEINKNRSNRSDSTNSYTFNYELINKQAEENYGMLYNAFSIKSLQDPIYQYNPTFLRIKDTAPQNSGQNSGESSRLSLNDDPDNPDQEHEHNDEKNNNHSHEYSMVNDGEISVRNNGFKITFDDTSDEEYEDVQILNKYKTELKKYEDEVIIHEPDDENKLEEIYDDLIKAKASIAPISKEKIKDLKNKDPVFAKRYRKFSSARNTGKVPIYQSENIPIRVAMPKSAIEKRKKEMMQSVDAKTSLRENPYMEEQLKLSEKVTDFVKNLSVK